MPIRVGVGTDEDVDAPEEERLRRFGQRDHVRWYGDDIDDRLSAAGLATVRVTPPALLGDAAVRWFGLMAGEVVWIARHGSGAAPAMLAGGPGTGLSVALDALITDLDHTRERLDRARARADRVAAQRDALRARLDRTREELAVARRGGVLTPLRRAVHL